MQRKKFVAANWKMNLGINEAVELAKDITKSLDGTTVEVALFPSHVFLGAVKNAVGNSTIAVGAQNCYNRENGAFTGEVSASQLQSLGIKYVIIGHSERREYFNETNAELKEKLHVAFRHELKPVFCCGEPSSVRNNNQQEHYVLHQLKESLFGLAEEQMVQTIIAYEPIWAIGTGATATPEQAEEMHTFIRKELATAYNKTLADKVRIIYGGSVNAGNASLLFSRPDVDGGLVGGASLKADDFLSIIKAAE